MQTNVYHICIEAVRVQTFGTFLCALHVGGPWPYPKTDIVVLRILGWREKMCLPDYGLDGPMDIYIYVDIFAIWIR